MEYRIFSFGKLRTLTKALPKEEFSYRSIEVTIVSIKHKSRRKHKKSLMNFKFVKFSDDLTYLHSPRYTNIRTATFKKSYNEKHSSSNSLLEQLQM